MILLANEVPRDRPIPLKAIKMPLEPLDAPPIAGETLVLAPRLCAGLVAREGVRNRQTIAPDAPIASASFDRELTEEGHFLPGLGDAGDRVYGTRSLWA